MENQVCVKVFTSKKGNRCTAICIKHGNGREMYLFAEKAKLMDLLDMKPTEFYDLPNGEYAIK